MGVIDSDTLNKECRNAQEFNRSFGLLDVSCCPHVEEDIDAFFTISATCSAKYWRIRSGKDETGRLKL